MYLIISCLSFLCFNFHLTDSLLFQRCIGLRFLFPVYCIPETELTKGKHTSLATIDYCEYSPSFGSAMVDPGNTKWGSITVPLTSCLTGLDLSVMQIKTNIVSCHTADSKPVKQEVNGTVIIPPLVFPGGSIDSLS
jgi:hypothetical protein